MNNNKTPFFFPLVPSACDRCTSVPSSKVHELLIFPFTTQQLWSESTSQPINAGGHREEKE
jgi:hypothetical protein